VTNDPKRTRVVFIAGPSYSGSTMLGLVLGTDPTACYAGEANQYMRRKDPSKGQAFGHRVCTCGDPYERCDFWSAVQRRYGLDADLNPAPGFSSRNLRLMLRILSPWPLGRRAGSGSEYGDLLTVVHDVATAEDGHIAYVVDSSKSIQSLDALASAPAIELYVVHLIRDGAGVAASYKRRGHGAFHGLASWALVHVFLWLYVRRRRLACLRVDYEALCAPGGAEIARLNHFLGTWLDPDDVARRVRGQRYHVLGGNRDVRQFIRSFKRIERRQAGAVLNGIERVAAALVAAPIEGFLRPRSGRRAAPAIPARG
jgi:hypothetical protein